MSLAEDLERWSFLPADMTPFAGPQIDALRRAGTFGATVEDAIVTVTPPGWVRPRRADAWLVAADATVAAPLLWSADGTELVASVVVERAPHQPRILRLTDIPSRGAVPLDGREVAFSRHASRLWAARLPDRDLNALLAADAAIVTRSRPKWIPERAKQAAFLILSHGRVIAPLRDGGLGRPAIATTIFQASEAHQ